MRQFECESAVFEGPDVGMVSEAGQASRDVRGLPMTARTLSAALIAGCLGCADTELYLPMVPPPPEPEVMPNEIKGTFCTEDPKTLVFPLKVWFIVDDSGSMQNNDPGQKRYSAIKELANKLKAPGERFWGGQIFAGDNRGARRFAMPVRFTDDITVLNAGIDGVATPGNGGTPYLAALNFAHGELSADVQEDPVKAKKTRYVVIFLSDGQPTDSGPAEILPVVDTIMSLRDKVGDIVVNTVWLGGGDAAAQSLLRDMAIRGKGIFKSFPNGDALDYSGFDFSSIRRTYVHRYFFVINRSMVPWNRGQSVDSDADGLPDSVEREIGTDPIKRDSDADGCGDLMETRVGWDPKVPRVSAAGRGECGCSPAEVANDTDKDELTDCEEKWLGTLSTDPDSDIGRDKQLQGDLVPDGIDYIYLDDATFPNMGADRDVDGFLDLQELEQHTNVKVNEAEERDRWAYKYPLFAQRKDEPRCYDFSVDNVTLGRTLKTADHAENENVLEFYVAQSPQDDPHTDRLFRVARKSVPYAEGGLVLSITPQDFTVVLQPRGPTAP